MPTSLVVSRPVCRELTWLAKPLLGREDGKATSADGPWHQSSTNTSQHIPTAHGAWCARWPPPRSLGQGHRGCLAGKVLAAHHAVLVPGAASAASVVTKL